MAANPRLTKKTVAPLLNPQNLSHSAEAGQSFVASINSATSARQFDTSFGSFYPSMTRFASLAVAAVALVPQPSVLGAPVEVLFGFPDVLPPTAEAEGHYDASSCCMVAHRPCS